MISMSENTERPHGVEKLVLDEISRPGEKLDYCQRCSELGLIQHGLCRKCRDEEWNKGIHGARPDEKLGDCSQCGYRSFVKNGKCRKCRGVCDDCGREDWPREELKKYGSGGEMLCPDCTICRLY